MLGQGGDEKPAGPALGFPVFATKNTTRVGGHVSVIGVLASEGDFNPISILMKSIRVQGIFVGSREMFEDMNRFITAKNLRPVIDRTFPFAQAGDAFRYLESGSHFGKVVVAM